MSIGWYVVVVRCSELLAHMSHMSKVLIFSVMGNVGRSILVNLCTVFDGKSQLSIVKLRMVY